MVDNNKAHYHCINKTKVVIQETVVLGVNTTNAQTV